MFILKKGHQPGVYVPLRALFLVLIALLENEFNIYLSPVLSKLISLQISGRKKKN